MEDGIGGSRGLGKISWGGFLSKSPVYCFDDEKFWLKKERKEGLERLRTYLERAVRQEIGRFLRLPMLHGRR